MQTKIKNFCPVSLILILCSCMLFDTEPTASCSLYAFAHYLFVTINWQSLQLCLQDHFGGHIALTTQHTLFLLLHQCELLMLLGPSRIELPMLQQPIRVICHHVTGAVYCPSYRNQSVYCSCYRSQSVYCPCYRSQWVY